MFSKILIRWKSPAKNTGMKQILVKLRGIQVPFYLNATFNNVS